MILTITVRAQVLKRQIHQHLDSLARDLTAIAREGSS